MPAPYRGTAEQYIAERILKEDRGYSSHCWIWQQTLNEKGYGMGCPPGFKSRAYRMHRAAYEIYVGPIPNGLVIDHLCRVTSCCNPEHLDVVTSAENTWRRHVSAPFRPGYCIRGHARTPENLRSGHNCIACEKLRDAARRGNTDGARYRTGHVEDRTLHDKGVPTS